MTRKTVISVFFLLINLIAFSQSNTDKSINSNLSIELSAGKLFSPCRFYKNHAGYEHISLGLSKEITERMGVLLSQSYARTFSQITNNRTLVMTTSVNPNFTFFSDNKINLRISVGTGLLHLYTKSLYDIYPLSEHIYGIPIHGSIAVFYNLSNKLALNLNFDAHYSFLFNGEYTLLINDPYYYKTFFNSISIGIRYNF